MSRPSSLLVLRVAVFVVGSVSLADCADVGEATRSDANPPFSEAGVAMPTETRPECRTLTDCDQNRICQFDVGTPVGHCTVPDGTCTPGDLVGDTPRTCYPDSRCDSARGAPRCTLTPPPLQAFQTRERITLTGPNERDAITAQSSVTLNWQPPSRVSGESSTSVAVIMAEPPRLRIETRQVQNTAAVRWIWSSADPGGAVEGRVTFDQGHKGIRHDGTVSAVRWGRGEFLEDGIYYWFVFNVANGQVTRSSGVQQFRVGAEVSPGSCNSAIQCTGLGEVPESFACINGACQRRCASEIDCAAVAGRCAYDGRFPSELRTSRHSGFCVFTTLPDGGTM